MDMDIILLQPSHLQTIWLVQDSLLHWKMVTYTISEELFRFLSLCFLLSLDASEIWEASVCWMGYKHRNTVFSIKFKQATLDLFDRMWLISVGWIHITFSSNLLTQHFNNNQLWMQPHVIITVWVAVAKNKNTTVFYLLQRTQKKTDKWTGMKGKGVEVEMGRGRVKGKTGSTLKKAASGPFFSYTLLDLPMAIIIPCMLGVIIICPGSRNHVKQNNKSLWRTKVSYYVMCSDGLNTPHSRHARHQSTVHALVRVAQVFGRGGGSQG